MIKIFQSPIINSRIIFNVQLFFSGNRLKMSVQEVEMKDVEKTESPEEKLKREKQEAFDNLLNGNIFIFNFLDIFNNIGLIRRGVQNNDDRLIGRAVRQVFAYRKRIDKLTLFHIISQNLPENSERKQVLLEQLKDVKTEVKQVDVKKVKKLPEVEAFLQILLVVFLIDTKQNQEALNCSTDLINFIQKNTKGTMNLLGSKAFFYYSRSYELNNKISLIRSNLLNAFRTACLRHDHFGQAMLINLLLRNYLSDNLYDQANKLITKSPNIDFRSNAQLSRFFYYKGRILSIQLEYGLAYDCLNQAIMKAPSTAKGFRLAAYKLLVIVKLLMGEIPEKSIFTQKGLSKPLQPYLALTKDVRVGDLLKFRKTVDQYSDVYKQDKTYSLIQRIRQNVIRTGLKKISLSYSRISFTDICEKLHLDNPEDVEYIVAKAIRDGIIDATIDHEHSFMQSKETIDTYSTSEPTQVFQNRVEFCLKIRNASVKAMRFPQVKKIKEKEEDDLLGIVEDIGDEEEDDIGDEFGL